ncbi:DUF4783 domain-containing protein [Maribellus sediminis]|uniref:DUF4783 domain-containing protein n=1 Tax=Maribellus sediminis TaxID=2696285 RepID=UPI001430D440|nr:DUF4783 domain-containing protein [Maribellus sediminis]
MSILKKISILSFLFVAILANTSFAQVPNDIITSFNTGDSKMLAEYFNQNVELVVMDDDNVYSKAQAEQIVASFFSSFTPVKENAFTIKFNSGKEAKSVIGQLKTTKGEFRVYFLLKKDGSKEYIHQLRIEKQ